MVNFDDLDQQEEYLPRMIPVGMIHHLPGLVRLSIVAGECARAADANLSLLASGHHTASEWFHEFHLHIVQDSTNGFRLLSLSIVHARHIGNGTQLGGTINILARRNEQTASLFQSKLIVNKI